MSLELGTGGRRTLLFIVALAGCELPGRSEPPGCCPVALALLDRGSAYCVAETTAARALTMPVPHWLQVAGNARVVARSFCSTWVGVSAELRDSIRATVPATCGVAIEVP